MADGQNVGDGATIVGEAIGHVQYFDKKDKKKINVSPSLMPPAKWFRRLSSVVNFQKTDQIFKTPQIL